MVRAHLHPTDDSHRVTTLELLFDLVFVYAITNVTGVMEHHVGGRSVLEGLIMLTVVWFGWSAYAWLGNQAKADEGLLRLAMILAMAGMFFVAISIPHAFDEHGNAAGVLVIAYAFERMVHLAVYLVAAGSDRQLQGVIATMFTVATVSLVPLAVGAFVSAHDRVWWWLASVLIDQAGVYFVRSTRWRLPSASHFAERFSLIIIIAIGESVVDLGAAASTGQLTLHTAVALLCGLAIAVCLWWLYFDVVALVAEGVLIASTGVRRARLARDSYTYLHLPMVCGIVFTALGLALLVPGRNVDAGRYALFGGIALYLAAHLAFRLRNIGSLNRGRAVTMVVLLVAVPVTSGLGTVALLAIPAAALVALVGWEVWAFRDWREQVRHREHSGAAESATAEMED